MKSSPLSARFFHALSAQSAALAAALLAVSMSGAALADELVITLQNGRTIVLDTAEIKSMIFTNTDHRNTIPLVPSPRNFTPESRPPGGGSATIRPIAGRDGNLAVSVTMTRVLPNHRYQFFLFVDGRNHAQPVEIITDRTGFGHTSTEFRVAPGERVVSLSIANQNSKDDIYVTPGIYENEGMTVRLPGPRP